MIKGKVKWYNETKGYGFISVENGKDIFVHKTGLVSPFNGLQADQEVEFEAQNGEKGMTAINVKVIS